MQITSVRKSVAVMGLCLGLVMTVAGQKTSPKRLTTHVHHSAVHQSNVAVAGPDESKQLNADLNRLEKQTERATNSPRSVRQKTVVPMGKAASNSAKNPPINFTYRGPKPTSTNHGGGGGGSRGTGLSMGKGMRMR